MIAAVSLLALLATSLVLSWAVKVNDQMTRDSRRRTYRVAFPADLDPERVTAWLRSISGTLRVAGLAKYISGMPSIALEVWATNQGIAHRIKIPWQYEPYVRPKLESLIPGIRLTPEDEFPERVWVHAVEAGLKAGHRQLDIHDPADVSTSILANFSSLADDETLVMQWVIAPAVPQHKPIYGEATSKERGITGFLFGSQATKDEIEDRRHKLDEPNMLGVLRVGAVASTTVRAQFMVRGVISSLDSSRGPSTHFYRRLVGAQGLRERIKRAASPLVLPVQLSAPELTAVLGWPLGSPLVAGLPPAVSRYIPAPAVVPAIGGITVGISNYPGRERHIVIPETEMTKHVHIVGSTGSGKSTLMTHMARQTMEKGHGLVLIEAKGDLFQSVLDNVPAGRINETIVLDLTDRNSQVGFNLLEQGPPSIVANELASMFNRVFGDASRGIWLHDLMTNGIPTLTLDPNATILDLPALVSPGADQIVWRDELIRKVKDPFIRSYWQRMDNQQPRNRDQRAEPVMSRFHVLTDPSIRNVIGQSKSTFRMDDVVRNNMILLVNLSGADKTSASMMGTTLLNALWNSIQRNHSQKGLHLYLDEFHRFLNIPVDTESMLVEARSMGLSMTLAHQQLAQITDDSLKQAIMTNARTKLLFNLNAKDARAMADEFGSTVAATDISNLSAYEMVARIMTPGGISSPFTLDTLPATKPQGTAGKVRYASRGTYARPISEIMDELTSRLHPDDTVQRRNRPRPVVEGWGGL